METEPGTDEELALEVGKEGQTIAVRVRLDAQTGEGLAVQATPLWRESDDIGREQLVNASASANRRIPTVIDDARAEERDDSTD
jgi:hypothetical protein